LGSSALRRQAAAALVYLKENGIRVFKDEERHGDATFTGRSAYFHDPDRNVIELLDSDK